MTNVMRKKSRAPVNGEIILDLLKHPKYVPLKKNEIFQKLHLPESKRNEYKRALRGLLDRGAIVKVRSNRFAIPSDIGLVIGTLRANEAGFGFVIADDPKNPDIFIPRHAISTAMHMDKVLVRLDDPSPRQNEKGPSGSIKRILERGNPTIVGTLASSPQFFHVVPDDPRLFNDVYVAKDVLNGARVGDRVVVKVTQWPSKHVNPEGVIDEILGHGSGGKVDLLAIIRKYQYSQEFPSKVMEEADRIPQTIPPKWVEGRQDLRKKTVFTIDPDDAKDYDDAISLQEHASGYVIGVHIADVSFYVKENSALDKEARGRGTSVYLPNCVLPMLPERLSNGVCSLKEGEDRMTKSVFLHCDKNGNIHKVDVAPSVIRSTKRFTYGEVLKIITEESPNVSEEVRPLVPILQTLALLTRQFYRQRSRRGSINLEIPKVKVLVDSQYRPTGVMREEQDQAHSLIEELMLLANEAVARYISNQGRPLIHRAHDRPDRQAFEEFAAFVRSLGYSFQASDISVRAIQDLLARLKGKPDEPIIHLHLLRSMKIAIYSHRNIGHFALALKFYAHFTSPIRRYPDLIIHRILDQIWEAKKPGVTSPPLSVDTLATMAAHSSKMERTATDAERELSNVKILQYLAGLTRSHSKRIYPGTITRIKSFGFFVEMEDVLVPGMVHLSSLKDDFYEVDLSKYLVWGRRRHRRFKIGQRVNVRIALVDLAKRQIDLNIA
jgi:ribonuclease R